MHQQPSDMPEVTPPKVVVPSRSDPLLRGMTEPVGGPLGTHTVPGKTDSGFFTIERVLIFMTAFSALIAVLTKTHCREAGWTTPDQYSTGCYSEFPNAFTQFNLANVFPFLSKNATFGDGPVAGFVAGITAWFTAWAGNGALRNLAFFDLNAGLIAILWIVVVLLIWKMSGRRPWDAAIVAASPLLILTAYMSWDFWAVGLVTLGIFLFARRRPLTAGFVLGIAAMAAPYAALVLLALVVLGIRHKKTTAMLEVLAAGAVGWLLIMVPAMSFNPSGWGAYISGMISKQPSNTSLYGGWNLIAGMLGVPGMSVETVNAVVVMFIVALLFGAGYLALRTPQAPRVAQLAAIMVGGYVVVGKFTEPWSAIWLLPLLALALPRWRPLLLWQAAVITSVIAWMLFQSKVLGNISSQHAIDTPFFVLSSLLSTGATVAVVVLLIREVLNPRLDVVRRGGVVDPQGGVLNSKEATKSHVSPADEVVEETAPDAEAAESLARVAAIDAENG